MSSDFSIEIENLSKAYLIYKQPRDRLLQALSRRTTPLLKHFRRMLGKEPVSKAYFTEHWALKNLSFKVGRGESIAIVGRNGSGKSTLLQLICGTLTPSTGSIRVTGRVAALLELGSGFNPEFSGRENIYLNASILGMGREEIDARIDQILAFADIGDFVDQPIKTYSTGMAMRLAFAVVAHIDADVLIIDEALAVGDAYFQQKCMRWLRAFRQKGTLLFCGHDMGAVMTLCDSAIWLDRGELVMDGGAKEVCEAYSAAIMSQAQGLSPEPKVPSSTTSTKSLEGANDALPQRSTVLPPPPESMKPVVFDVLDESAEFGSGRARIKSVSLREGAGEPLNSLTGGEDVVVSIEVEALDEIFAPIIGFHIKDRLGQAILGDNTFLKYSDDPLTVQSGGRLIARFRFRLPNLASGRYSITAACASGTLDNHVQHHWIHDAIVFDMHSPYRNGVMIAVEMKELHLDLVT